MSWVGYARFWGVNVRVAVGNAVYGSARQWIPVSGWTLITAWISVTA